MRITFKTLAIATSICSALILSPVSFADCNGEGPGNQSGFNKGPQNSEKRLAKLTKKLDLTEEQQAQVKILQAENQAQNLALKPSMEAYKEQMKAIMSAETFDEEAFTLLKSSNQEVFDAKALIKAKHIFAMKNVLTEEQLVKFEKMKKRKSGKSRK